MAHHTRQSTLAARHKFEKAIERNSKSAEALAGLAHVLMIDYLRGWNGANKDNIQLAKQHLDAIDQPLALAHVAEAQIHEAKGKLPDAINELNTAIDLDPDLAIAYAHKANAKILLGRAKKAPELLAKAISSRDPDLGLCYWFMGRAYFNMKKYEDAIWWLNKSVEVRPTTWFSWAHLISAYALTDGGLEKPEAKAALKTYCKEFQADRPLLSIKHYYDTEKKYKCPPVELYKALDEYYKGLEKAAGSSSLAVT